MRILADENFPGPVIAALRAIGHDVLAVAEACRGANDETVLDRARQDHRILLTFDKDFGELAFRLGLPADSGVILFRLSGAGAEADNRRIITALELREEWTGTFSVITDELVRMRPLPGDAAKQP